MQDKANYESREQAWIKHWLLEKYLEKLVLKIGTKWKRFLYVDAFAGPWDATSSDLSDTSFSRALSVLEACAAKLQENGVSIQMRAIFLEKKKSSAKRLVEYANDYSGKVKIEAKCADFLDEVDSIASSIGQDEFAFILVDPTGFKDVTSPRVLAPLLDKRGVELMINLMWDHINRFWDHPEQQGTLADIFGESRNEDVSRIGGNDERARCSLYTDRLRMRAGHSGGKLWASAFPVLNPRKRRTHYYLVYTTHSHKGLLTFSQVAEGTWKEQSNTRAQVKLKAQMIDGQSSLFAIDEVDVIEARSFDVKSLEDAWLRLVPNVGAEIVVDETTMARLMEECSCLECDLQLVVKSLIDRKILANLATDRVRPKRPIHPENREKLRRIA